MSRRWWQPSCGLLLCSELSVPPGLTRCTTNDDERPHGTVSVFWLTMLRVALFPSCWLVLLGFPGGRCVYGAVVAVFAAMPLAQQPDRRVSRPTEQNGGAQQLTAQSLTASLRYFRALRSSCTAPLGRSYIPTTHCDGRQRVLACVHRPPAHTHSAAVATTHCVESCSQLTSASQATFMPVTMHRAPTPRSIPPHS